MWNYRKLSRRESPMAEILAKCSCKANINLVIYHLSENHVECATVPNVDQFRLGETARTIKADSQHNHAILAYDLGTNEVYKIDDVPELPVASAVLLCVVTELMNGAVMPRENQYGAPVAARKVAAPTNNVHLSLGDTASVLVSTKNQTKVYHFGEWMVNLLFFKCPISSDG